MFGRQLLKDGGYSFTDGVRRALQEAAKQARALKHEYVGTEHLLLGLLEVPGDASRLLERLEVPLAEARAAVLAVVRLGSKGPVTAGALPYTSRAKMVLQLAMEETAAAGLEHVSTVGLLLGLIREGRGVAAQVLADVFGVKVERARLLARVLASGAEAVEGRAVRIELDDGSDLSIYEQIVAQVREAVATSAVQAGDRLPTVRQLADQLDIAPGTVARAYAELERRGIVVTGGARGTRIAGAAREAAPDGQRIEKLVGLLRPVAVAAFHLGASSAEVRTALATAMEGIFPGDSSPRDPGNAAEG